MKLCPMLSNSNKCLHSQKVKQFSQNSGYNWSYDFSKEHCYIKSYLTSSGDCHKCFVINRPKCKHYEKECRIIMVDPNVPLTIFDKLILN